MKKLLFSAFTCLLTISISAQVLISDNFESLTLGDLGTSTAGNVAGQNSWYTLNGANIDYQIETIDAIHGKSLTLTGGDSFVTAPNNNANNRLAAKFGTATASLGNNILSAKYDLYTGASSGSGATQMRIWGDAAGTSRTIGGFLYDFTTKELRGLATVNNIGAGTPGPATYSFGFAAAPGITFPANTWITLEVRYNTTTGSITWIYPGGAGAVSAATANYTLIPGMIAEDLYVYNVTSAGNFISNTISVDNIMVQFSNAAALSTNEVFDQKEIISIYPNPTTDFLNIKMDEKVKSVSIFDMSGRKIDINISDNKVDVRSLQSGTYLITVESAKGKYSEKFIKK